MKKPRIAGIGTAVPPHRITQGEVRDVMRIVYGDESPLVDKMLSVFDHDHIGARYVIRSIPWYFEPRGLRETTEAFVESAIDLACTAARRALDDAGRAASDIASIIVVSTTGIATPSLDSYVIRRLGLSPHVHRTPIFGLGCAGGVAGLARAAEACRHHDGRPVLLIAVEICSVTFQRGDTSKSNIVGASLFADGAAAVVIDVQGNGPAIRSSFSTLYPDTDDIMGWDVVDTGFKVRFSRDIPEFIMTHLPGTFSEALEGWGISRDDVGTFLAHPGGAKVIDAYATALTIAEDDEAMAAAKGVLHDYGNLSSASVLFVIDRILRERIVWPRRYGVAMALGPGFSAELVLLERPS